MRIQVPEFLIILNIAENANLRMDLIKDALLAIAGPELRTTDFAIKMKLDIPKIEPITVIDQDGIERTYQTILKGFSGTFDLLSKTFSYRQETIYIGPFVRLSRTPDSVCSDIYECILHVGQKSAILYQTNYTNNVLPAVVVPIRDIMNYYSKAGVTNDDRVLTILREVIAIPDKNNARNRRSAYTSRVPRNRD
jgi:hypothetical protein